jgi:hypothetical protein
MAGGVQLPGVIDFTNPQIANLLMSVGAQALGISADLVSGLGWAAKIVADQFSGGTTVLAAEEGVLDPATALYEDSQVARTGGDGTFLEGRPILTPDQVGGVNDGLTTREYAELDLRSGSRISNSMQQALSVSMNLRRAPSIWAGRNGAGDLTWQGPGEDGVNTRGVPPTETMNYGDAVHAFNGLEREDLERVQRLLYDAGFLTQEVSWGRLDPQNRDYLAWQNALAMAAKTGKEVFQVLDSHAEAGVGDALRGLGGGRMPDIRRTSAADIQAVGDEIAQQLLGRKLRPSEKRRIVATVQGREVGEGTAAAKARMSEGGGAVYTDPTSLKTSLDEAVEAVAPQEKQATDAARSFDSFLKML